MCIEYGNQISEDIRQHIHKTIEIVEYKVTTIDGYEKCTLDLNFELAFDLYNNLTIATDFPKHMRDQVLIYSTDETMDALLRLLFIEHLYGHADMAKTYLIKYGKFISHYSVEGLIEDYEKQRMLQVDHFIEVSEDCFVDLEETYADATDLFEPHAVHTLKSYFIELRHCEWDHLKGNFLFTLEFKAIY